MGAWGPGIFSDDVACDVRDKYRELLEDGHDGDDAARLLIARFKEMAGDEDDGPVFWLALAAAQWKRGRLQDDVKNRALKIIEDGEGLQRWEDEGPAALSKRKAALERLMEQINQPQPPARAVRKRWVYQTEFQIGDAISYRLDSGQYVIFRVIGLDENRYHRSPILELCDWVGNALPSPGQIARLAYIVEVGSGFEAAERVVTPHKKSAYPSDRIQVIARGLKVRRTPRPNMWSTWQGENIELNRIAGCLSTRVPRILHRKWRRIER